jgi:hypothetical protein
MNWPNKLYDPPVGERRKSLVESIPMLAKHENPD